MKLSKANYLKARNFILTNARMIERRLFEFHFANGNKNGVFHAVYAYRNPDVALVTEWNQIQLHQKVNRCLALWLLKRLMKLAV